MIGQRATESRPGRSEDQDQDQTEVEDQDQTEVQDQDQNQDQTENEDQHQHQDQAQAEAELNDDDGDDDDLPAFSLPRAFGSGTLVTGSAGNLIASFTTEELRTAAYQLGSLLELHTQWAGYTVFLARREAGSLSILLEWTLCHRRGFYRRPARSAEHGRARMQAHSVLF